MAKDQSVFVSPRNRRETTVVTTVPWHPAPRSLSLANSWPRLRGDILLAKMYSALKPLVLFDITGFRAESGGPQ